MIDELRRLFAFRLAHGAEDSRLGHPPEVVFDRRNPAGGDHVEVESLGQAIRMGECARPAIIRLEHRVDRQRDAMREERLPAVTVKCRQCVPQFRWLLRQSGDPRLVAAIEAGGERGVVQTRRLRTEADAFHIEFKAGIHCITIEHLDAERMERREEGHVRLLAERMPKRESAVRGQFGHQPVGNGLQALVLVRFRRAHRFGLHGVDVSVHLCGDCPLAIVFCVADRFGLDGCFVLRTNIAALDAEMAAAIDADESAGACDLGRIETDGSMDLPCKSGEPSPMKDSGGGDEQEQTKTIYERVQTGGGAADADQRTQRRAGCK